MWKLNINKSFETEYIDPCKDLERRNIVVQIFPVGTFARLE